MFNMLNYDTLLNTAVTSLIEVVNKQISGVKEESADKHLNKIKEYLIKTGNFDKDICIDEISRFMTNEGLQAVYMRSNLPIAETKAGTPIYIGFIIAYLKDEIDDSINLLLRCIACTENGDKLAVMYKDNMTNPNIMSGTGRGSMIVMHYGRLNQKVDESSINTALTLAIRAVSDAQKLSKF